MELCGDQTTHDGIDLLLLLFFPIPLSDKTFCQGGNTDCYFFMLVLGVKGLGLQGYWPGMFSQP